MIKFPEHIKDANGFLYFSSNTRGQSGNPVKIHADLFVDFFRSVDPDTYDGQTVIRDIENLRAFGKLNSTPAQAPRKIKGLKDHRETLERLYKIQDQMRSYQTLARDRSLTTKNVRVYFQIDQKQGDKFPTIYISEVQVIHSGKDNVGGLYEFVKKLTGTQISKSSSNDLKSNDVYVSRASESLDDAISSAKAAMLNQKEPPAVFYNPMSVADDLGYGKAKTIGNSTAAIVKELRDIIQKNQSKKIKWHVEGEGAAVLKQALEGYSGSLENHSFRLIDARTDLNALLGQLNKSKAQLKGEFIHYSGDRMALLAIANKADELNQRIKDLPTGEGYDRLSRQYLVKYLGALGSNSQAQSVVKQASSARFSTLTFVDLLTNAIRGFR